MTAKNQSNKRRKQRARAKKTIGKLVGAKSRKMRKTYEQTKLSERNEIKAAAAVDKIKAKIFAHLYNMCMYVYFHMPL